ncbi:MAG: hypothetical protein Q9M44_06360 [Ghiorsea sp.]|nr:hypothetical protein [Ghiorsea sp.]
MNQNLFIRLAVGIIAVIIISGCASKNVYKDKSYSKVLSEVSIATVNAKFGGSALNKEVALLLKRAPVYLLAEMKKRGVKVVPYVDAKEALIIQAKNAKTSCVRGGKCYTTVWYSVQLKDIKAKKLIWSGEFRAPSPHGVRGIIKDFSEEVMDSLDNSKLLPSEKK